MATGGLNLSKEFFELLKAIGESKSKQEEDRIIAKEVTRLKHKLETPPSSTPGAPPGPNPLMTSKKRAKEFLVRLLYVEMLGHDASFGYIKAVEMAASASLFHKRTGYLVCGACLPPEHEFRFMLVNQMQRDLQSANVLECSGGLLACTNLITADMVPAVSTEVTKLLQHDSSTIRKKSIICLHRFHQLAPDSVPASQLHEHCRRILCDKDPSVMGSSLNVVEALAARDPVPFKDLVPSLVSILKQVADHRLPSEYDYHRVPAPWMQIKLVRILGLLGRADAPTSSGMYEVLHDTMRKADNGINAGYAIVYECIRTIVTIYPNNALLDAAADAISRFMQSRSHNLKYLGVTGLALVVETHPQYAAQHQLAVMDCLEDTDETLQRKTLDLLYRMTNPVNVEFIAEKLIDFLSKTTDLFLKKVLTSRVCAIAERYAPNNTWYIRTITQLFEVAGDLVSHQVAQNLMSLIAEGTGEGEQADHILRQQTIELYVQLLRDKPVASLPRILLETMAWCLGEYGYLSEASTVDHVLLLLCQLARTHKAKLATSTRKFLLSAIMKLVAQAGTCPPHAAAVIDDYTRSKDFDLQQRCLEFQKILTSCPQILPEILPVDASAEDVDVDTDLSFLNGYVQQSLANGARPYQKPEDDDDDDDDEYGRGANGHAAPAFNMKPYEKPQAPAHVIMSMSGLGSATIRTSTPAGVSLPPGAAQVPVAPPTPVAVQVGPVGLNTRNMANVWGRGGLHAPAPSAPAAASAQTSATPGSTAWSEPSHSSSSSSQAYGGTYGYGGSATAAPAPEPVKTAEQLEKERMAAALFGGIVPGAPPPPSSSLYASAPAAPPPPPQPVAPPVPAPSPAPPPPAAPAADFDLLDMSAWDSSPAPATAPPVVDFGDSYPPPSAAATIPAASIAVETVDVASPAPMNDPFASAGLLSDVLDKPLASLSLSSAKFEYNGVAMAPLPITTPQFGQQWGSCPASSSISLQSIKVTTLNQFMDICSQVGAHKVEAISSANEGICAGMFHGGGKVVLIHGKVSSMGGSGKIDATVKSNDQPLSASLAMYLQTQLR